jgi:hypothetical protein
MRFEQEHFNHERGALSTRLKARILPGNLWGPLLPKFEEIPREPCNKESVDQHPKGANRYLKASSETISTFLHVAVAKGELSYLDIGLDRFSGEVLLQAPQRVGYERMPRQFRISDLQCWNPLSTRVTLKNFCVSEPSTRADITLFQSGKHEFNPD